MSGADLSAPGLRDALKGSLPEYMVPSQVVVLERLPLTANGKLDRTALPAPSGDLQRPYEAPSTDAEIAIAAVCRQLLSVEMISVDDNFFDLGLDSILSIQLVSRLRRAGWQVSPKQVFEAQTVGALAQITRPGSSEAQLDDKPLVGEVPLTPIQHWFFAQRQVEPNHNNQSLLLDVASEIDDDLLERALGAVVQRHPALSFRFECEETRWHQHAVFPLPDFRLQREHVSPSTADTSGDFSTRLNALQASLHLTSGRVFVAVLFDFGTARDRQLLLIAHHLVIDGVSWRILVEDLDAELSAILAGTQVLPASAPATITRWHDHLIGNLGQVVNELPYWRQALAAVTPLPVEAANPSNLVANEVRVATALSQDQTRVLLHRAGQAYGADVQDLLLTALAQTLGGWLSQQWVCIDLESHGRDLDTSEFDLTRSVGWHTAKYPFCLQVPVGIATPQLLKLTKQNLRDVPNGGLGYGALRYMHPRDEIRSQLASDDPYISFNYLGQFDPGSQSPYLRLSSEERGLERSSSNARTHLIDVVALVHGGALSVEWLFSEAVFDRAEITKLAGHFLENLNGLIAHCLSDGAGGYTPSDFPMANLSQAQLDNMFFGPRRLDSLYPLSPVQQGMLFHSQFAKDSGVYCVHLAVEFEEKLDLDVLAAVLNSVARRHPALRTSFMWDEDLDEPLQMVHSDLSFSIEALDWRELDQEDIAPRLRQFLLEDRLRGIDLSASSLNRWTVIEMPQGRQTLVWLHHHILFDGWSVAIVLQEVFANYARLLAGQAVSTAVSPRFESYVAWLRQQNPEPLRSFWSGYLSGFAAPTPLPNADSSHGKANHGFLKRVVTYSTELGDKIDLFARQARVTPAVLFQAVWGLLLSFYSGSKDVVYGSTTAGRPAEMPGIEQAVGMFINTLPLRIRIDSNTTVRTWLTQLQSELVDWRRHEYASLLDVRKWSDIPATHPLFETLLVFENYPVDSAVASAQFSVPIARIETFESTNYPLVLVVNPGQPYRLSITYATELFNADDIDQILASLLRIVSEVIADPQRTLRELSWVSGDQRDHIINEFNDAVRDFPRDRCLHQLFAEGAARWSDQVAVVDGRSKTTFKELEEQSNQMANVLLERGIGPGAIVAICLPRSAQLLVGMLGVLKSGAAYLPVDASYPADRIRFMVDDSSAAAVIGQNSLLDSLGIAPALRLPSDDRETVALLGQASRSPPGVDCDASFPAYLIYTSGSTGRPKGVLISHRSLVNYVDWARAEYLHSGHGAPVQSSIAFDATITSLFVPLLAGQPIYPVAEGDEIDGLCHVLERIGHASVVKITPAHLQVLLGRYPSAADIPWRVGTFVIGGEELPARLVKAWLEAMPSARFVNEYGPTETVVGCAVHTVSLEDCAGVTVPIGRPIGNTRLYVLDAEGRVLPPGVSGELYIGGAGVGLGYLNRAELTAARFLPDPFVAGPGGRLYRSGDRARWRSDGVLEFLGRVDDQVKLRGYRIELGEIELCLLEHPLVVSCAVLVRGTDADHRQLVAYVIFSDGESQPTAEELRAHLARRLPAYMLPGHFIPMAKLPLTVNGKLDKAVLPAPDAHQSGPKGEPRSDLESELVCIWSEVLGTESIGVFDNFFELGGHSLLVAKLRNRIRMKLQLELPLRALFEVPTVAGQAELIRASSQLGEGSAAEPAGADEFDEGIL
ncbi:amino acid adenylation domain-containing protein [Immundisolibacter sp.]|uniref:amino acid adenylation domain-containing protein n=1 Tax=Immundisolibacter sp. TaxID=1934948 RepID=UPI003568E8B0